MVVEMKRKMFIVGMVAMLLSGMIMAPATYGNASASNFSRSEDDTIPVIIRIFGFDGIDEIRIEMSMAEAERLAGLEKEDSYTVVKEIHRLGLLGEMSIEDALSLVNGDYQRQHVVFPRVDGGLFNVLCSVNFSGSCMMLPVFPFRCMFHLLAVMNYLISLGIPPSLLLPLWIPLFLSYLLFLPVDIVAEFVGLYVPVKPPLFRGFLIGNELYMKTSGLFGVRETCGNYTTVFRVRGFTGIWITNMLTHHSWGRGFALSICQWQ